MPWFHDVGASLSRPTNPAITFVTIDRVLSLALMLLKTSGGNADAYGQLHAFIYSCLIYDQYASEWNMKNGNNCKGQGKRWKNLAALPCLVEQDKNSLKWNYHGRIIGDVPLTLPIPSFDPQRLGQGAPKRLEAMASAEYKSSDLNLEEFTEVAYMVRCNLLHGSLDLRNDEHAATVLMVGLRFTSLLRWVVQNTAWKD